MTDFYVGIPDPLGFMRWARHHCKGGRSRSARHMDRRAFVNNPELQSPNSDVRHVAWSQLGPFNTPVYPHRGTDEGVQERTRADQMCHWCGRSLRGKRLGAMYCSDAHRKRHVRDNEARSVYMGKVMEKKMIWCPVCREFHEFTVAPAGTSAALPKSAYRGQAKTK